MSLARRLVGLAALVLFGTWAVANLGRITGVEEGLVRLVLGLLFAVLILFRPKAADRPAGPRWLIPAAGVAGAMMAVGGTVFRVHQAEWMGIVLVLYACLRWAMPARHGRDIALALFLLYWVHPLPGQVFGRLQLAMQAASIRGAEALLHAANVRCWADGFILRLGYRVFGVPEACSGMRTAVTVLLCTLGVCALLRMRWYETLALLFAGLVQVLALNILRIAALVYWAPRMPPEWSQTVLHDTLGIFLLVSILLVQAEASWWGMAAARRRRRTEGVEKGELDHPDKASRLPRTVLAIFKWAWVAALLLAVAAGVALLVYRSRPAHRSAMIAGAVDGMLRADPEAAERGLAAALALTPGDRELLGKRAQLLLSQKRYPEALAAFQALPAPLTPAEVILSSWALTALGRTEEAVAQIQSLPPDMQRAPGVAIVKAEHASRRDQPAEAAANAVLAARSHLVIERVRALFPYLASREQWRAIANCGSPVPPRDLAPTLIEVDANLRMREMADAAGLLKQAIQKWPEEPRFLSSLFKLAAGTPGGEWEQLFASTLRKSLEGLDVSHLATYINYSFQLSRPDLAWQAYRKLQRLDPSDPALYLAPVEFGGVWFSFRKNDLRLQARNAFETTDLRNLYRATRGMEGLDVFWRTIPLARELAEGQPRDVRKKYLDLAILELDRRRAAGEMSERLELTYPLALGMAERYDEAHAMLDSLMKKYPDRKSAILLQHAVFYDRQGDWQRSYETLLEHEQSTVMPGLSPQLMLVNAMMSLNLAVGAMDVISRCREVFPGAVQLDAAESGIWAAFGFSEEALFILEQRGASADPGAVAQLLYETGRVREADDAARAVGYRIRGREALPRQPMRAPPTELTIARRWPEPLSAEKMAQAAKDHAALAAKSASPFIRALETALAEWHAAGGRGDASDAARWEKIGRNDVEKAAALHRVAMALATQKEYAKAAVAARRAVELLPASPILRRSLIALTEGDAAVVREARQACPRDADIWLASLAARARDEGLGDWAKEEVRSAVERKVFPPMTMVRAGEFLLGRGRADAAAAAARDAVGRARGYVPAYVLGANAALAVQDLAWALDCALRGAMEALNPAPFHELIVRIKTARDETDADLVAALEFLKERFPQESQWSEHLGHVYFRERDTKRALSVLDEALRSNLKGMRVRSLVLAAESARLQGDPARAVSILETAYRLHPGDTNLLNNLVYTLAETPAGLPRARELLPELLKLDSRNFAVLDTAAAVYLKSGDLEKAKTYMERALAGMDEKNYAALDVKLNSAELLMRLGKLADARERASAVRRDPRRTDIVDVRARDILSRIEREMGGQKNKAP